MEFPMAFRLENPHGQHPARPSAQATIAFIFVDESWMDEEKNHTGKPHWFFGFFTLKSRKNMVPKIAKRSSGNSGIGMDWAFQGLGSRYGPLYRPQSFHGLNTCRFFGIKMNWSRAAQVRKKTAVLTTIGRQRQKIPHESQIVWQAQSPWTIPNTIRNGGLLFGFTTSRTHKQMKRLETQLPTRILSAICWCRRPFHWRFRKLPHRLHRLLLGSSQLAPGCNNHQWEFHISSSTAHLKPYFGGISPEIWPWKERPCLACGLSFTSFYTYYT